MPVCGTEKISQMVSLQPYGVIPRGYFRSAKTTDAESSHCARCYWPLCMAGTQRETEALHFPCFHTPTREWDATWVNWIECSFWDTFICLPPFLVAAAADNSRPFRSLLCFAKVGIQKGTASKALNMWRGLEKFWNENRLGFYVKMVLSCPGGVRRCVNRLCETERSLIRKVAGSCSCKENKDQRGTTMKRALWQ